MSPTFQKSLFITTLYIAGFQDGKPWVYCKVISPWLPEDEQPIYFDGVLPTHRVFLTDGDVKEEIKDKMNGRIYLSEYDVIESLREYVQEGSKLSNRVSSVCDIYKISLVEGMEVVTKMV